MTATCPVCKREQDAGLLCHSCTSALERELGDVAAIVGELDISLSKQARIGTPGQSGLARERTPLNMGAMQAADNLGNVLTTWARDVCGESGAWLAIASSPAKASARALLSGIDAIRRHPAVTELVDEIGDAITQARRAVDRPGNRTIIFVGPCPELNAEGGNCDGEVHAYIPTEDDRPSRMECRTNPLHKWTSIQWMRAGKRILDRIEERKREARGAA